MQLSRTLWCGKVLLDPSTSAILLDQSTGQQQLNVTAGILAPKAPLGLIDEWIAKAPSHRTFKKPLFAKIRFLGKVLTIIHQVHMAVPDTLRIFTVWGSFCIGHSMDLTYLHVVSQYLQVARDTKYLLIVCLVSCLLFRDKVRDYP